MTSVHILTFGCSINQADSEVMAGLLKEAGFSIVPRDQADVLIINTCTVKTPTENRFRRILEEVKDSHHIIIAGCIPQTVPETLAGYSLVGTSQINHIVEAVEETINGNNVVMLTEEKNPRLNIPKIRKNPVVEIVPIASGCMGSCSYCITRKARGSLLSYDPDQIVSHIRRSVRQGVREVWLTAQDTGCYGKDIGSSLPELLRRVNDINGEFMIRLGMMNPDHLKDLIDDLLPIYDSRKMFKFIHIPVQSGNDEVLSRMRRKYSADDFLELAARVKERHKHMTIATDVICGFPGETEEQFGDTLDLIRKVRPDVVNISRYWDRPGTESSMMEDKVHGNENKERSRKMKSVFEWISFENNKKWRDWEGQVIVDEHGKDNSSVARNFAYKPVIIQEKQQLGSIHKVKVKTTTIYDLRA